MGILLGPSLFDHVPFYGTTDQNNLLTTLETNMALTKLYRGQLFDAQWTSYVLGVLHDIKPGLNYIIPGQLPAEASVAHKIGYYDDAENDAVLGRIARSLALGGRFLLDMANRDWVLTHPQQRTWNSYPNDTLVMEEISLDLRSSRVTSRQILIPPRGGSQVVKTFDLRVYTCAELAALMDRHGLEVREVWGGADRSPYSTESRRLVMLAERVVQAGKP